MKKMSVTLIALILMAMLAISLADNGADPGAGKPTVPMPDNNSFDNPAILVPETFYQGMANKAYEIAFIPPVTGTYTIYGKTDGEAELAFQIRDEQKNSIGWKFNNNKKRAPVERNVELEAGKTYTIFIDDPHHDGCQCLRDIVRIWISETYSKRSLRICIDQQDLLACHSQSDAQVCGDRCFAYIMRSFA